MSKELVIELRVPLPDGMFESAAIITKAQGVQETIRQRACAEFGEDAGNFMLKVDTVTKRAGAGHKKTAEQETAKQETSEQPAPQEAAEQPVEGHHPESRRHRNGSAERTAA